MSNFNKNNINGWLILNKPSGISSAKAVGVVKSILNIKKLGHCGTLDPLASGVLPIALGEATKVSSLILNEKKSYLFDINWGIETATGDLEGDITKKSENIPTKSEVNDAIKSLLGKSLQTPPIYSAIKVNGQPAYKLARLGKKVKLEPREIFIENFKLIKHNSKSSRLEVVCSKGTYIRSLAVELGKLLNTYGHICWLYRVFAGPFNEINSFSLDSVRDLSHSGRIDDAILPLQRGLDDILALNVDDIVAKKLRFGQKVAITMSQNEKKVLVVCGDKPVAIAQIVNGYIAPKKVFNI
ncbi:MAG: tRNA pseudouridine synthase B [Alphaproteobacteria bacterium MarineAlpha2_Bin1]|nr:MAG: tRNA pseudouridine synthase B [Alphaproteobacteria bacterium MarineAlpha2_Bin1]